MSTVSLVRIEPEIIDTDDRKQLIFHFPPDLRFGPIEQNALEAKFASLYWVVSRPCYADRLILNIRDVRLGRVTEIVSLVNWHIQEVNEEAQTRADRAQAQ